MCLISVLTRWQIAELPVIKDVFTSRRVAELLILESEFTA